MNEVLRLALISMCKDFMEFLDSIRAWRASYIVEMASMETRLDAMEQEIKELKSRDTRQYH